MIPDSQFNQAVIPAGAGRFTLRSRLHGIVGLQHVKLEKYTQEEAELVGLFKLGATASAKKKTGLKIIALVKSVGVMPESADLKAFKENPRAWLHAAGYMYDGPGAGPNGEIPATVKIVPVFDTADTMHVRVPFKDALLINPADIPVSETYPSGLEDRFPVFLARYFMRQCR